MSIKLVAFDVDGVLTDGSVTYDENGVEACGIQRSQRIEGIGKPGKNVQRQDRPQRALCIEAGSGSSCTHEPHPAKSVRLRAPSEEGKHRLRDSLPGTALRAIERTHGSPYLLSDPDLRDARLPPRGSARVAMAGY